jgi:hypothetical protein
LKLRKFFNFATKLPRLIRRQMLPFYAFVGKLHTLLETVAAGIHLMCESFTGSAELFIHPDYSPDPAGRSERLYRAQQGHQRSWFEEQSQ